MEVQWRNDYARYKALMASLADEHFHVIGERGEGEYTLLLQRMKTTGWSTAQCVLGLWVDTEDVKVRLPQRKVEDLRQQLASWPPEQREATA